MPGMEEETSESSTRLTPSSKVRQPFRLDFTGSPDTAWHFLPKRRAFRDP